MKGFLILLCFSLFSYAPPRLVKTKITDDITVLIPKNFRPMDELDFTQRYPSVRQPIGAYTNEFREVDFSVNISATQWSPSDVEIARKFFKAGVVNMFDGVEMINEGTQLVNGKQFIFFEFESRVRGDQSKVDLRDPVLNYTYIQYLVQSGRTLVFSFTCPRRIREDWQSTAHKMMKGIKVK